MTTKCKMCGFLDTKIGNGDCDGCSECYSIEQGFYYISDHDSIEDLCVDEDGNLWDQDCENIVGFDLKYK